MTINPKILAAIGLALVLAIAGALFFADRNGYNRAVAKYNATAAEAAEKARKEQAELQATINNLMDEAAQAALRQSERNNELNDTKDRLRAERQERLRLAAAESPTDGCPIPEPDDSAYRMFNSAADSPDLQDHSRQQEPDEEMDGIDAVQYAVGQYNLAAINANALAAIIRSRPECFIFE